MVKRYSSVLLRASVQGEKVVCKHYLSHAGVFQVDVREVSQDKARAVRNGLEEKKQQVSKSQSKAEWGKAEDKCEDMRFRSYIEVFSFKILVLEGSRMTRVEICL